MTSKSEKQLLAALESVALPIAHATERVPTTAATPEQIDLVYALRRLAGVIPRLLPKVITGELESNHWSHLADILHQTARLCREQVVIDADVGR